ncbi:MAG: DNA adenine methylase [Chloroflexaceae bacterium]|nr:DNA adenine methylase [Chloroflexaceae bacterium]
MRLLATKPRPFLKWAGGKTRLLEQLARHLPREMKQGRIRRYIEPFVGGGAMLFYMASVYQVPELVICDVNDELTLCYRTLRDDVEAVIDCLDELHRRYHAAAPAEREQMFYAIREQFNATRPQIDFRHFSPVWIERTAQIIFLNHTCFNGLFRLNSRGDFNVPFGKYKNPGIYDTENLHAVSHVLQDTTIISGHFTVSEQFVTPDSFVYFDPPYRPISKTSSFTSYSKLDFNDEDQRQLAHFFRRLHTTGAKLMLSNSDPKNTNPEDDFFEVLYDGFHIHRVLAARAINARGDKRGEISELVITNY